MKTWKGRTFQGENQIRELHSDSFQNAWAGVDVTTGHLVQEFWRDKAGLHINVKELEAAINTVQSLANPGEHVLLKVDNTVTFWYLTKGGGRIPSLNQQVRPFLKWCMEKEITLIVQQVKSTEDLADGPSRWSKDKGDYTLDKHLFQHLVHKMKETFCPMVDMFAHHSFVLRPP